MQKNIAGQKWIVFAFDSTTGLAKTGDLLNITANLRLDGGAANPVDDTNPAELEGGYYAFDLTDVETNGNMIVICPSSVTANIVVVGVPGAVWTESDFTATMKASLNAATPADMALNSTVAKETTLDTVKADTVEVLTRVPDATAGTVGGLPTVAVGGLKLAQTVDLTVGQSITASNIGVRNIN